MSNNDDDEDDLSLLYNSPDFINNYGKDTRLSLGETGKLAKFRKEIENCVWKARGNGINHYSKWFEFPVSPIDDEMFKKIDIPQLELREPFHAQHSMDMVKNE